MARRVTMIHGITETSFLDWDGKITTVLYTARCNFRCPFCHNWQLMEHPEKYPEKDMESVWGYLEGHSDFIDGVCITGGEPTLEPGLEPLIRGIRSRNLLVKLDTNGCRPDVLEHLLAGGLLDYVAMDVKMPPDIRYEKAAGVEVDTDLIKRSVGMLKASGVEHEFRTTVVPGIHSPEDVVDIARFLAGGRYVLQQFNPGNAWEPSLRDLKPYDGEEMEEMAGRCREFVDEVTVRGTG